MAPDLLLPSVTPVAETSRRVNERENEMHAETMYMLAKLRQAELLQQAEHERLVRRAGRPKGPSTIDAARFRQRVTRLFGPSWRSSRPAEA